MPINKKPNVGGHPIDTTPEHAARKEAHEKIKDFNRKWGSLIGGLRSKDIVDPSHISDYIKEREQLDIPEGFDRKMLPPKISPQTHVSAKQRWEQHQQSNKRQNADTIDYASMNRPKTKESEAPTLDYGKMNQVKQKEPERTFSWDRMNRVKKTLSDSAPEKRTLPRIKRLEQSLQKTVEVIDSLEKSTKKRPFKGYNKKRHARTGGLNEKAREKMNREEGTNLKRPVTKKNPTGKDAARRKSFCARMSGVKGPTSKDGELTPKGAALKRWRCRKSMESLHRAMLAKTAPEDKNLQRLRTENAQGYQSGVHTPDTPSGGESLAGWWGRHADSIKAKGITNKDQIKDYLKAKNQERQIHEMKLEDLKMKKPLPLPKSMEKAEGRCWEGYEPVQGKKPYSRGSCIKKSRELMKAYKSSGKWKVAGEVPNSPEGLKKEKGIHLQHPERPRGVSDAGDASAYWRGQARQASNPRNSPQERMQHRVFAGKARSEARAHHERVLNEMRDMPKPDLPKSVNEKELVKGPYLQQGSKLGQELYDETQNIERKKTRTGREAQGAGIRAEQLWGGKAGYRTGKQQAEMQAKKDRAKSKKNPVRTLADLSPEEKAALEAQYTTRKSILAKTKELLMKPPKSEAQRRFMGAVKAGKVPNVPKEVGEEFLEDDSGKKLPEKVKKSEITAIKIGKGELPKGLEAGHKRRLSREYKELYRQAKVKGDHKDARVFAERSKQLSEESRSAGAAKPLSSS